MQALARIVGDSLLIDEEALRKGVLFVEFDWPLNGSPVPLRAIYPDSFPRQRPIVQLRGDPSTFPSRHCSPMDGTLCLLGRDSGQWQQKWTLRNLLEFQLESALADTGDEDPQGEPAEYWWNGIAQRGSYCLIDSSWQLGGATEGALQLRYRLRKEDKRSVIQAVVTEVRDSSGAVIESWTGAMPADLAAGQEILIPWVYIDQTILPDPELRGVAEARERFSRTPPHRPLSPSLTAQWFAVLYRMETGFQTFGLGWLFPFTFGPKKAFRPGKPGKLQHVLRTAIIPTYRAGDRDLGNRVPAVVVLRDKRIAVVGLGAVGGPLAVELARNGCRKLHLVDHDVVEPGNAIRWPLGASAWGHAKTETLPGFIGREYPWTEVVPHNHAIGGFDDGHPEKGDDTLFEAIMPDIHLVVDGTASYGVSTILSDQCRARGISLISLYASPPVEGGVVARFAPQSGCPTCLEFAYHADTIERAPGFGDETGFQQPPGCAERTFTGASYDLQELSLQAMRLIIETFQDGEGSGTSVLHTLSLVTDGRRTPPVWRLDALPKAEGCSCATSG